MEPQVMEPVNTMDVTPSKMDTNPNTVDLSADDKISADTITIVAEVTDEGEEATVGPLVWSTTDMSIGGGKWFWKRPPVHETMTIAALIASNFKLDSYSSYNKAIDLEQRDILEFLRGIVWNDDPGNALFIDNWFTRNNNYSMGTGAEWFSYYNEGSFYKFDATLNSPNGRLNIISRSHFGDLQFLHGMAQKEGESPAETKEKIMTWMEVMYRVAIGNISHNTSLKDVELPHRYGNDRYPLRILFTHDSKPKDSDSVYQLIAPEKGYGSVKLDHRALGSCLHLIQDSYARGHCERYTDRQDNRVPRRYGEIINFHTYKGQNHDEHSKHDFSDSNMDTINCADLSQFQHMDGCTDAIEQCTKLINFWHSRTPWENRVGEWLRDEVFKVSPNATSANANIV